MTPTALTRVAQRRVAGLAAIGLLATLALAVVAPATAQSPSPLGSLHQVNIGNGPDGKDFSMRSGEPEVAVNPKNPANLAFVSMASTQRYEGAVVPGSTTPADGAATFPATCKVAISNDSGLTWKQTGWPGSSTQFPGCGDPMVAYDAQGTLFIAWDALTFIPFAAFAAVQVTWSKDGGRTWHAPVHTGAPEDRPWLEVDKSTGTVYVASSCLFHNDPRYTPQCVLGDRGIVASHNGGQTFGGRRLIDSPLYPSGANISSPIAAANGVLAAAYSALSAPEGGCPCVVFETSANDGQVWTRHIVPTAPGFGLTNVAAHPSKRGTYAIFGSGDGGSLITQMTHDSGRTWARPVTIAADPEASPSRLWMNFGPTGALGFVWRSTLADGTLNTWTAVTTDEGRTIVRGKLNDKPGPAPDPYQIGTDDQSFVALDRNFVHVGYGDWRSGDLSAWYARYRLPGAATTLAPAGRAVAQRPAAQRSGTTPAARTLPTTGLSPLAGLTALCCAVLALALRRRRRDRIAG